MCMHCGSLRRDMYVHQITCISLQVNINRVWLLLWTLWTPSRSFNSVLQWVYSSVRVSLQQYIQKGELSLRLCLDSELNAGLYSVQVVEEFLQSVDCECSACVIKVPLPEGDVRCCQSCLFYILHYWVSDCHWLWSPHGCTIGLLIHWPTECQEGGK